MKIWRSVVCPFVYIALLQVLTFRQRPWCTEHFKTTDCLNEAGRKALRRNSTDLKVVLPSYGQTGTTSVIEALRLLGYRAYHADDYSTLSKPIMFDNVDWGTWAEFVTRCRMEAMSLEPTTDMLPIAVAKAPQAKFIMTWRPFPAWRKSTRFSRAKEIRFDIVQLPLLKSNMFFPWFELIDWLTGVIRRERMEGGPYVGNFSRALFTYRLLCNGYRWPTVHTHDRGTFKNGGSEEAYLAHINEIRMSVPKERLMEFDVKKHGWNELEMFLFGRKSWRKRFPQPRSAHLRTNEKLMENNWGITGPVYLFFATLHAVNYVLLTIVLGYMADPVRKAVDRLFHHCFPAASCEQGRLDTALEASPVLAVLEGVQPEESVPVAQALVEVGVRVLAVPITAPGSLQSLRLLVEALPQGAVVGASSVCTENEICAVQQAGGSFVVNPIMDSWLIRRAKGLGLVSLPGVCTPSEALGALQRGADGLHAFPAEQLGPSKLKAWRAVLPPSTRVLITGVDDLGDLAGYWAAGVGGFGAGAALFRPGDSPDVVRQRAASFLKACLDARPGGEKS